MNRANGLTVFSDARLVQSVRLVVTFPANAALLFSSSPQNIPSLQRMGQGSTKGMVLPGPHQSQGTAITTTGSESKAKKICCACPDTKRLRDECIVEHGEAACTKWIEAHRQCLRAEGFNV